MARLAGRLALSPIPLYLAAGLALGEGGLLPLVTSQSFVETGAELGVILLLLMLGLEYSGRELVDNLRPAMPVGILDLVLDFLPGLAAGLILGPGPVPSLSVRHGERISELAFPDSDEGHLLTVLGVTLVVAGLAE